MHAYLSAIYIRFLWPAPALKSCSIAVIQQQIDFRPLFVQHLLLQDLEYRDRLEKAGKVLYALTHETSDIEQKEAGN